MICVIRTLSFFSANLHLFFGYALLFVSIDAAFEEFGVAGNVVIRR